MGSTNAVSVPTAFTYAGKRYSGLIVGTVEFLFDLDWLVENEKRFENHFFRGIFTCFVAFGEA
jgi:hypothetical protein